MEQLKSSPITNLDATPIVMLTAGEGLPGMARVATDYVNPTTAVAAFATYRLCRIPTNSKVKKVQLYTTGVDSTTAPAGFDVNVAFSDSAADGTPQALQGTIPSSKHDGTSIAFNGTTGYSTAYTNTGTGNKLFGVLLTQGSAGATLNREITFGNVTSGVGFTPANRDDDLWNILGFTANGQAQDPGGFFDFLVVMGTVGTAAAGTIAIECDFVV